VDSGRGGAALSPVARAGTPLLLETLQNHLPALLDPLCRNRSSARESRYNSVSRPSLSGAYGRTGELFMWAHGCDQWQDGLRTINMGKPGGGHMLIGVIAIARYRFT